MSDVIKHSKKFLSVALTITTIVWSVGLSVLAPMSAGAVAGDLVKEVGDNTVYLVDANGVTIHPFPHANVYTSWGFPQDFSTVLTTNLSGFTVGNDVEFRDGSLVRALEAPAVYVVSNKQLRPVLSAAVYETLGYSYDNITWLPQSFLDKYGSLGDMISSTTVHPSGTLVKYANSSTIYLIVGSTRRAFASTSVLNANGYGATPVITIPSSETYPDGSQIVVKETASIVPTGVGTAPTDTTPPGQVGTSLSVSLASDSPVAASIIDDSTSTTSGAQAFVPFVKVGLTAGSDGAVKVTTIKFERSGISSDADLSALYLYEGDTLGTLLAESQSFSSGMVTFTNSSGLITVPAGQTKYVTMRADLANDTGSGKTINFKLTSASGVTTDGASVSGSFPVQGSTMSVATAANLGYITVANVSPTGATTVNPGTTDHEAWRFSLVASDQDMEVRWLKIDMTGSAGNTDLSNWRLQVAGVDIAPAVPQMTTSDEIVFNFATPYVIESGQTKNVSLIVNVDSGSTRTIHFQIQDMYNLVAYDKEYNVFTKTNQTDTWTVIESHTSTTSTTINSGSLTVGKSSDSPTGNIAAGATSILMAKFDFTAAGEDIRINSLKVTTPSAIAGLDNVKVFFNGSQVGSTSDSDATNDDADFSFGTSVVVPAGTTKVIAVYADVKNAAGTNLTAGTDTVAITLAAGSANARALSSSTSISTTAVTANTLSVASGSLLVAENLSVTDATSGNPSGVAGQANVLIGSFVVTAGAGEGVTITQFTMTDDVAAATGSSLADTFQNLRLASGGSADMNGNYAAGAAIGITAGTLTDTADTTYNFNPSPSIKLNKSQQMVINVYADLKNSATQTQLDTVNGDNAATTGGVIYPSTISATGNDTTASANGTMAAGLQNVYIAAVGALTPTVDAGTPEATTLIMGATDQQLAKFKLEASNSEDISVTKLVFSIAATPADTTAVAGNGTSTIGFVKNFDLLANGVLVGTISSAATTDSSGNAPETTGYNGLLEYNLTSAPFTVARGTSVVLTVRGDVITSTQGAASNAQYKIILDGDYSDAASTQSPIEARGLASGTSLTGTTILAAATNLDTTKTHVIRKSKPTIATSGAGTTLSNATMTVYKFTVTADAAGDVSIKKMTFDVTIGNNDTDEGPKLTSFSIRETGASSAISSVGFFTNSAAGSATGNATGTAADLASDRSGSTASITGASYASSTFQMIFGYDPTSATNEELVISAGETKTYEIRASIAGVEATGDSVAVRVASLNETAVDNPTSGVVFTATDSHRMIIATGTDFFIWSDYSADVGAHDATVDTTSADFFNGYLVKTFPTEYYTNSK